MKKTHITLTTWAINLAVPPSSPSSRPPKERKRTQRRYRKHKTTQNMLLRMNRLMAARASNAAGRTIATRTTARAQEPITEVSQHASASTAWEKSCYNKIDYTISDDLSVYDAVQRFSAYNVGALVTTNGDGQYLWRYIGKGLHQQNSTVREDEQRDPHKGNRHDVAQLDRRDQERHYKLLHGKDALKRHPSLAIGR